MHKFWVAERGLETQISEVISDKEMARRMEEEPDSFAPNMHWRSVTVKDASMQDEWVRLQNEWLYCCWCPNQDRETQERNGARMQELERMMKELEVER